MGLGICISTRVQFLLCDEARHPGRLVTRHLEEQQHCRESHREQMVVWESTAGKTFDLFMSLKGTLEGWVYLGDKLVQCVSVLGGEGCGASGEKDEPPPHMNNESVLWE